MRITLPDYTENLPKMPRPPVDLLREVGADLPNKTNGVVYASILSVNPGGGLLFRHTFSLSVPRLNDYTHTLFYVHHNPNLYPATFLPAETRQNEGIECATELILTSELQIYFQSRQTVDLIQQLINAAGH